MNASHSRDAQGVGDHEPNEWTQDKGLWCFVSSTVEPLTKATPEMRPPLYKGHFARSQMCILIQINPWYKPTPLYRPKFHSPMVATISLSLYHCHSPSYHVYVRALCDWCRVWHVHSFQGWREQTHRTSGGHDWKGPSQTWDPDQLCNAMLYGPMRWGCYEMGFLDQLLLLITLYLLLLSPTRFIRGGSEHS